MFRLDYVSNLNWNNNHFEVVNQEKYVFTWGEFESLNIDDVKQGWENKSS